MTTRKFMSRLAMTCTATAMTMSLAFSASAANAGPGARAAMRGDFTRHTERMRTENGRERHSRLTDSAGRTVSRDSSVANDRASGTRVRDGTVTLPDGRTATRNATVGRDPETGTRTREAVAIGPGGQTRTLSDVTQRTDDGFARATVVTRADGSTVTRSVDASFDAETRAVVKDVSVDHEKDATPAR